MVVLVDSTRLDINTPIVEEFPDGLKATAYFEDYLSRLFDDIENINVQAGPAYGIINTDAGTVTADEPTDELNLTGGTGISTSAVEGDPDAIEIVNTAPFIDAPSDGTVYGREDGDWVNVTLQRVYNAASAPPQLTLNGTPDPLTIRASVAGGVLTVQDQAAANVIRAATTGFTIGDGATAYTFPLLDGAANQILQTDGAGVLSFINATALGLTLQDAYDADTSLPQILINGTPDPFTIDASVTGDIMLVRNTIGQAHITIAEAGSTIIGGTAASQRLFLRGSHNSNRGIVEHLGATDIDYDWTTDVGSNAITWSNVIPASGAVVSSMFVMSNTVTVNSGTFIPSAVRELSSYEWTALPGFAVSTLFLSQPRYFSTTPGIPPAQSFTYAAQPTHESFGAGAITTVQFRGVSANVIMRARLNGDTMTLTSNYGLTFSGLWNTNNAGATIDFGNSAAVKCTNPTTVLFGQALGTERCVNWYGIDFDNITLVTTGERAVVHSSLLPNAINYFLKNDGGAQSDFGGGHLFDLGITQHLGDGIGFSSSYGAAGGDVTVYWDGGQLIFNPLVGANLEFDFAILSGQDSYLFQAENFPGPVATPTQIRFGFDRFAFGQAGTIGNQVGVFVAGTREVGVAGGWSDYLLTQSGSLDITTFAMSDVTAWTINSISLAAATGSIVSLDTFVVGGMTTSNPGITVTERSAQRVRGRQKQEGSVQYPPINPAALSAGNNNDWAGLLTGSPNNNTRFWARIEGAATATITGIDATAVQDGDTFELTNVDTTDPIDITHQDAASVAANRIITPTGATYTLDPDETVVIRYDATTARWRLLAGTGA